MSSKKGRKRIGREIETEGPGKDAKHLAESADPLSTIKAVGKSYENDREKKALQARCTFFPALEHGALGNFAG